VSFCVCYGVCQGHSRPGIILHTHTHTHTQVTRRKETKTCHLLQPIMEVKSGEHSRGSFFVFVFWFREVGCETGSNRNDHAC